MQVMQTLLLIMAAATLFGGTALSATSSASQDSQAARPVAILPIRDDINTPMVFLVRRGVKEAIEKGADLLVVDMDTNGGRVDKTQEIIEVLSQFPGSTATFVNKKAFSAGAFIAFGTQKIYMSPEAVIGAAAPILAAPGGGATEMNETLEAKMNSAVAAMVRASAEKNGHNVDVADSMVRRTKELLIDGETLNQQGEILTLTSRAASKSYGNPPKPLLSAGTHSSLDALLESLGRGASPRMQIELTGWERVGAFLSSQIVTMILLILGAGGIYIEFKSPGFGIPGIVGIVAFGIYFLGGYIAGLSGAGWMVLFFIGLALLVVELFIVPGTLVAGISGLFLMLVSLVMSLVDLYPVPGRWLPTVPGRDAFVEPIQTLAMAVLGSIVTIWALGKILPRTSLYRELLNPASSGAKADAQLLHQRETLLGKEGVATSPLRPGGRGQFGEVLCDIMTRGELIEPGTRVRIVDFSGAQAVVEAVPNHS
ncbi:MAG: hypothetical protein FJ405_02095 [Verrucomicrobia bacterium]|nr:hypothetical protein [Verrucomicrobiota bacterium]